MKFNEDKCVVLKIGASLDYIYTLNGTRLEEVQEQRDLGVIINNKITVVSHQEYYFQCIITLVYD